MPTNHDYFLWYSNTYSQLVNYGLWLRGGEINTLLREEYAKRPYRILFARLSTYTDVSSSFTHSLLYEIAALNKNIFPDLAYLPYEPDVRVFKRDDIPWLIGTGTKKGPGAFNMIGFSNSIVQELINIPVFLKNSGIPLLKSERMKDASVPLIILGGANALYSSCLWGDEPPIDGIFTGESTAFIKKIFDACAEMHTRGRSKQEILSMLSEIPGFFEPDNIKATMKAKIDNDTCPDVPKEQIMSYDAETMGEGYLEISRGCRAFCSFCSENWSRKPYAEARPEDVVRKALELKTGSGLEKINLSSFNFNLYTDIYRLIWELTPIFNEIGLKTQRFDILGEDPAMIEYQFAIGKNTFSCGLEGISPRLRKYLNKNLADFALIKSFTEVFKHRPRELKVFLLSTGLEEEYDYKEFEKFLNFIKGQKEKHRAKTRVIFSVTPLVCFPWTPLEFADACAEDVHNKMFQRIRKDAEERGFEARQAMDAYEYAVSQILVRASGIKIREALFAAVSELGFVYYRKVSGEFFSRFRKNLEKQGLSLAVLLKGFSIEESAAKPWAGIGTGVDRKFLWETFLKNKEFAEIGESLNKIKIEPDKNSAAELRNRIDILKKSEKKISFPVEVDEARRGIPRKYFGLALARALMKTHPGLAGHFRRYDTSLMCPDSLKPGWITGRDIITLVWGREAEPHFAEMKNDSKFFEQVNLYLDGFGKLLDLAPDTAIPVFGLSVHSEFEADFSGFFKKRGVKYTLYKKTPDAFYLEFTKDSFKKKIASKFSGDISKGIVDIVPGEKFVIEEFLKEAYRLQRKSDWVKCTIEAVVV